MCEEKEKQIFIKHEERMAVGVVPGAACEYKQISLCSLAQPKDNLRKKGFSNAMNIISEA